MIGVCEERRRSQNEAIKGHFIFGNKECVQAFGEGLFLLQRKPAGRYPHCGFLFMPF
jgi:hypothetical protein